MYENFINWKILIGIIILIINIIIILIAAFVLRRKFIEADKLRKNAEAVSDTKSDFLAMISREIRTPMNSIVGFSELALDNEVSLKNRDYLNKIKINAQWLLQIINDILDISMVESGRMNIGNIPFDMHELLSNCRTLIMPKAAEKGLFLYFYAEPGLGKTPLGDPVRLRQVLVNLLSNAVKFTNNGMVKLHAVLKEMSDNSITMTFEIKDSGIGMTNEQINNILQPIIQTEKGKKRKSGGTGLGLAITKKIIELMGGSLSIESTLGIGSKLSFELVFDTINSDNEELFEKKLVFNDLDKPVFKGEILLCEDNIMNQQVIFDHLTRVGFKAVIADNGKIGYEMVKSRLDKNEKQFDLVFMDIHMPEMDGLEAASKITELNTGVPIVAMTANIMYNDREIYKKSGMFDCVGKPFTNQELWRCLMKYFIPQNVSNTGMDNNQGIDSFSSKSDWEIQKELQVLFIENNSHIYDEITGALETADIILAKRLTHSLKTNAAYIGKIILQKSAAAVENRLVDGKNQVTEEQLKTLKTELDMVLNEFSSNMQ
ncbi:MAG: ATP-binding protein [Treponema sp.]|nr:ATP-binding protein [Treponema sp.]